MTDRTYRTLLGLLLLTGLYFELELLNYGIIIMLAFESITNLRVPRLVNLTRSHILHDGQDYSGSDQFSEARFKMESERVWRMLVCVFLIIGFYFFDILWFIPWFMGFAIFGAGVSGLCPALLAIRWLGFR